jgi:hypothetical protein
MIITGSIIIYIKLHVKIQQLAIDILLIPRMYSYDYWKMKSFFWY